MNELLETFNTINNLMETAKILIKLGEKVDKGSKLATILEYLHIKTQGIIDDYCVEE
jgi:hypothetical protein